MTHKDNGKISPTSVMYGDVIEFYDCMENSGAPSDEPVLGIVVDIKDSDNKILGYRVLPLEAEPKNFYVKEPNFYMIGNRRDVDDMGLNTDRNYKVHYGELFVANNKEHVSAPGDKNKSRGVRRLGTLQGTDLFERICRKRNNDLPLELHGFSRSSAMERIEDYQMASQGENVHKARARQDSYDEGDNLTSEFPGPHRS